MTIHVIPTGDLREHQGTEKCWCLPEEDGECSGLFVHNSLDGREPYETGERKAS